MPGDVVHFTSLAFRESPHSTVPFSSGKAICNNTSGIEAMERERERGGQRERQREREREGERKPPLSLPFNKKKRKKTRKSAEIRPERLGCGAHSPPPVYLHWAAAGVTRSPRMQCGGQWEHYERVQSAQPSVRQILWANCSVYAGEKQGGTKRCLRETCARRFNNWS